MASGRPASSRPLSIRGPVAALDVLTAEERSAVLATVLAAHPQLVDEAEVVAHGLLTEATIETVASGVSSAVGLLPLEDLGARCGRVPGGYVHESEAAWELVQDAVEPFLADMRRRASVGLMDAAAVVASGIVAGLYRVRDPEDGTVLAYAGPDVPGDLAVEVLTEAKRLGLVINEDVPQRHWSWWIDLS